MFQVLFFYLFFFTDSQVADYPTLVGFVFSFVIRCSTIAGKYATYSTNQYKKLKELKLTDKELSQELMLGGWWYQKPESIELEIDSTIKR
jgi:hypothetical protein